MAFAVIRVRGHSKVNHDIEDTMMHAPPEPGQPLRHHCPRTTAMKGMLQKTKDYVTWGEVSEETLARMMKFRGRLVGDKPIDDEVVKERIGVQLDPRPVQGRLRQDEDPVLPR